MAAAGTGGRLVLYGTKTGITAVAVMPVRRAVWRLAVLLSPVFRGQEYS